MSKVANGRLTAFAVAFGIVLVFAIICIITVILVKLYCCCKKKKLPNHSEDLENLLNPSEEIPSERESNTKIQLRRNPSISFDNTKMDCAIEYRTRGTQLIVGVANVIPASKSWKLKSESSCSKIFLIIYVDGDSLNSPCESTLHDLSDSILFNEIFIFTVMPYDLSSLNLVIRTVLICGNWKYDIGTLNLPLVELDQNSYSINRIQLVPFPKERSLVQECLLSLSIMKCKNTIKLKLVKLFFVNIVPKNEPTTGLHLRAQITDFQNPLQVFDTTKKLFQQCVTFNELIIFQFEKPLSNSLELEVQLLESYNTENGESVSVCGRTVLYFIKDEDVASNPVVKNHDHLQEVINNPDQEIVRWHFIPYVRSTI